MKSPIAKVRAPNKTTWKITQDRSAWDNSLHVKVKLVWKHNNKWIGEVRLYEQQESGVFETHSDLDYNHHNKGWGAKLYARAIQWCMENGYKVRSSGCTSDLAQRVWRGKSIRKYFRIVTKPYWYSDGSRGDLSMDVFHPTRKPKRR